MNYMNVLVCNLCSRKLSEHTYQESLDCATKLIKNGKKKLGMNQHRLKQSTSWNYHYVDISLVSNRLMPYGYDKTRTERRCEKCDKMLYVFEVGKFCIECSRT